MQFFTGAIINAEPASFPQIYFMIYNAAAEAL